MSSHLRKHHAVHRAAVVEHSRKVGEVEAVVMDLTGPQAKAALMLLVRDFPEEVLEALKHKGAGS